MFEDKSSLENYLDLRGVPCPVNYARSCLAIEDLNENDSLIIDLDKGEPYQMVYNGLSKAGHDIKILIDNLTWVRVLVVFSVK